jgi:methylenetetrahydrofolate dehydrogenase (NADP+)/methenyltetrahydrofolate cyclohydrolase
MGNIISGTPIAQAIKEEVKKEVTALRAKGKIPGLATILVGDDPASQTYVASKIKACAEMGIESFHHKLPGRTTEQELGALIEKLNNDKKVTGILLQIPLPKHLDADRLIEKISPDKDVDGLTPASIGRFVSAKSWDEIVKNKLLLPCTPSGIIEIMKKSNLEIAGKNAVVIGRSNLVGKPIAMLLLANNATVTVAHSKTKNLEQLCSAADILVAAIGKPNFVTAAFVKKGAVVIDVGINRTEKGLVGDVDFESAKTVAGHITPVPGGVGKMTIAMLMKNTVLATLK